MNLISIPLVGTNGRTDYEEWKVFTYETLSSTNDEAKAMVEAEVEGNLIVKAGNQTKGKGRNGKSWWSLEGSSLLVSFVYDCTCAFKASAAVSIACAQSAEFFCGERAFVKWPNDIYVKGKKIAGVLSERTYPKKERVVAGLGINVNIEQSCFPIWLSRRATSLSAMSGKTTDVEEVFLDVLNRLAHIKNLDEHEVAVMYNDRLAGLGEAVGVINSTTAPERNNCETVVKGVMKGVNENGALILDIDEKETVITSGEIIISIK